MIAAGRQGGSSSTAEGGGSGLLWACRVLADMSTIPAIWWPQVRIPDPFCIPDQTVNIASGARLHAFFDGNKYPTLVL